MDEKKKFTTSIQYQLTNNEMFREVYVNWPVFSENLKKGPEVMKEYLFTKWNEVKDKLKDNPDLEIQDIDKVVTKDDFDVTINVTKNGTRIFFLIFPDCDFIDASSKYVAIAMTPKIPRYYTLEYSKNFLTDTPQWVIGEFVIEKDQKVHRNYGPTDNMRISWFAGYLLGRLEAENL